MASKTERILSYLPGTFRAAEGSTRPSALRAIAAAFGSELQAGENTLNALCARMVTRTIAADGGRYGAFHAPAQCLYADSAAANFDAIAQALATPVWSRGILRMIRDFVQQLLDRRRWV